MGGGKRREMGKREPGEKGEGGIGGGENKRTIKARTAKRTPPHGRVVQERKAGGRELNSVPGLESFCSKGQDEKSREEPKAEEPCFAMLIGTIVGLLSRVSLGPDSCELLNSDTGN